LIYSNLQAGDHAEAINRGLVLAAAAKQAGKAHFEVPILNPTGVPRLQESAPT